MLLTQTQFAQHRGVTKGAVSNWKKAGLLVLADPGNGKLLVDVVRTEAKLNGKIDPVRGRPTTGGASPAGAAGGGGDSPALLLDEPTAKGFPLGATGANDLADERLQHLREQRTGQALKNAQLAGELVALVEAERRVAEIGRVARERIQAQLRGMAERLASETDQRAIMVLLEQRVDQVFSELADMAAQGAFGEDDAELSAEETAELEAAAESDA